MKMKFRILLYSVIILSVVLAGCQSQTPVVQKPTIDTNALRTEVAQTIEAANTLSAAQTLAAEPTATVEIATATLEPSPTLPQVTSTSTTMALEPTVTKNISYPTITPTYYPDRAELVSMTPVLGKSFKPGADFDLVFTLKNIGDRAWTTSFRLEYASGVEASSQSGTTYTVQPLTEKIATGKTVVIRLDMIAPSAPGHYTSTWAFVNDDGTTFYTVSYGFDVTNP